MALLITLVAGDLGAKALARLALRASDIELAPFLALRLRYNDGSTFGFVPVEYSGWLIAIVVAVLFSLGWFYAGRRQGAVVAGTAFVSAGGIGNFLDRTLRGTVTDFVAIGFDRWRLPIFNLADVFLLLGMLLLIGRRSTSSTP